MTAESIRKDWRGEPILRRWLQLAAALVLLILASACEPAEPVEPASHTAGITGYNFTSEGVQEFYVNGQWGSNLPPYGGGGGTSCCVNLPSQWRPGLVAKIDWTIGHYTLPSSQTASMTAEQVRTCCWSQRTLSKTVAIERYGNEGGRLQVFFLPNDEIKVWVHDAGPQNPGHPSGMGYPKKPSPQEE